MASIERTAYPRFKPSLTTNELHILYEPTEEERDFIATYARGEAQQLTLLTLLKCQQHLGYLPALADVPDQIRTYLCQQLHLLPLMDGHAEAESTLYRYHQLIRTDLDIKPYGEGGQVVVETAVQQAAYTMSDPADLINLAIEHLIQQRFELPAFSRPYSTEAAIRPNRPLIGREKSAWPLHIRPRHLIVPARDRWQDFAPWCGR